METRYTEMDVLDTLYRRVLITGGTGSFGNKMVEQIEENGVARHIRVLSRDELKQSQMRKKHPDVEFVIGDVRNFDSVKKAMKDVEYVFHAAALKQVPSCEFYPEQAVKTNIIGTNNVLKAGAESSTVQKVAVLSTDKAVAPVNVMGMTKGVGERLASYWNSQADGKQFCCVRYGNVIGSRGSVIPLFLSQAKQGRTLTVTSTDMTRFLLTLDQATKFVLQVSHRADGGEVFLPKLPSIKIIDLAKLIDMEFGHKSGIEIVGIRPGEKIHEVLASEEEAYRTYDAGEYYKVLPTFEGQEGEPIEGEISSKDHVVRELDFWKKLLRGDGWL